MPARVYIESHKGVPLKINGEGEISVTTHSHPPLEETKNTLPFRSYFENSGSNDMRVNGSSTNVSFSIAADKDYDYFIKGIHVKLADAGAKLDKFGALTALTNGILFQWSNLNDGAITIHEGIKSNIAFFRMSTQTPQIIDLSGGGADSINVYIDLTNLFGAEFGIRLKKGTTDSLSFIVRDNLSTGLDEFNIIGYGLKI